MVSAKEIIVELLKAEAKGAGVFLTPEGISWLDSRAEEESGLAAIALTVIDKKLA
ncbi:hypothetical protein D3C81_1430350 [compost metagenome]